MRRLARIFANPATIALGVLAFLGGLRGLLDVHTSPVALALPRPLSVAWSILYGLGGIGMLYGTIARNPKVESFGWTAFSGGAFVSAAATATLVNTLPLLTLYSVATLVALGVCGVVKAYLLRAGYRLVWVKVPKEGADG